MSEKGTSESKSPTDTFSLVKAHLSEGYQNTQRTIQFQDLKASTIIGLSTLFAGLMVAAGKWILEFEFKADLTIFSELSNLRYLHLLTCGIISALVALMFCSACILCCIWGVIPRIPNNDCFRPYILFPLCSRTRNAKNKRMGRKKEAGDKTQADILSEEIDILFQAGDSELSELTRCIRNDYKFQLIQVGEIVFKKIMYVQWGVRWFFTQMAFSAIALLFVILFLALTALKG